MKITPFSLVVIAAACFHAALSVFGDVHDEILGGLEAMENELVASTWQKCENFANFTSTSAYKNLVVEKEGRRIWTKAIQRAIDENESVIIPPSDEPYWVDATILLPSHRQIFAEGAEIVAVPGMVEALVKNVGWQDGVKSPKKNLPPDETIAIHGGVWNLGADRRKVNHDAIFMFSNVKGLSLDALTLKRAREFAVQISDAENVVVKELNFDTCFADGVHVNGPVKNIVVRKLTGHCGDDFVALNAYDWPGCSHDFGPIENALIEDISMPTGISSPEKDRCKSMRLLPGFHQYEDGSEVECSIENVIVRRVNGLRSFKAYFQSKPYLLEEGPDKYHYAKSKSGHEHNIFFEDLAVDLDHPPDMLKPCREGDKERGHSAAFELGADMGEVYIRNVDVYANLERYPHLKVAMVGPKTYGLPGREGGDPYLNIKVDHLTLENVRVHGGEMKNGPVDVYAFKDINHDGKSSGRGEIGELTMKNVSYHKDTDYRRLQGAVGEKADKLFKARLYSPKGRGDIHEETVNAFKTRFDDLHSDPPGTEHHSGYWQGEYWGKGMLSHLAYARYSKSAEEIEFIHQEALRLIENFQKEDGYLATYQDPDFIVGWNWNIWGRKYTMWALIEAYDLTNDERLLQAAVKMAEHLNAQLKQMKVTIDKTGCFSGLPSMSILKPLCLIINRTGNRAARELAKSIIELNEKSGVSIIANAFTEKPVHEWLEQCEEWAKAYEFMSVCEGIVQYAAVFKEPRYLEAIERVYEKLEKYELNAVGGVGYHDHFIAARTLNDTITECCDVIHWMRLSRYLYEATGKAKYLDNWEYAFYNAFMAGVNRDGKWASHDVRSHGTRHLQGVYEVGMKYHFCCIANDPRGFGDWSEVAVEEVNPTELKVNFYSDGEYCVKGVKVKLAGDYPVGEKVTLTVESPRAMTLKLRVPGWCDQLSIDGRACRSVAAARLQVAPGKSVHALEFSMPPKIVAWESELPPSPASKEYIADMFNMAMHNKEMADGRYLRSHPGYRVMKGPMVLAKCELSGEDDVSIFGELGLDDSWSVTAERSSATETWGAWRLNFKKGDTTFTKQASDYQSSADFEDWRNSFSIWF